MDLERIRQKVEAGEALSDAEFGVLENAARQQGGPALRTAIGQALINSKATERAIPVLEQTRKDFPNDLQVHLALARALISVEKWNEAVAPLERALSINPDDPEAIKALAVIAMRRGEFSRAIAWVDRVLEIDPLDTEAQQLSMELHAAHPFEHKQPASMVEFTRALVTELKARSTPHIIQRQQVMVRTTKGEIVRLDVEALYDEFTQSGQALPTAIASIARSLSEQTLGIPLGRLPLLSRVLPVVRDSSFLERGVGAARREGPSGLWIFYGIDDPELVRYVPEGILSRLRLSLDDVDQAAWRNLEARPAPLRAVELEHGALRLSPRPTGLWAFAQGDGHDAARLLTASHQQSVEHVLGTSTCRVYLGLRELVIVAREDDVAACAKLEGLDSAAEGVSGSWRLHNGKLLERSVWANV